MNPAWHLPITVCVLSPANPQLSLCNIARKTEKAFAFPYN